jgi:hypothetical protein
MSLDTRQIIKNICSELSNSEALDDFIQMAVELTDRSFFGNMAPYAIAYRACHLFTITGGNNSGNTALGMGQITSMSEGGLSVTFAHNQSSSNSNNGLDTTKYGKLLLEIIKTRPTMGVNTAGVPARL